MFCAASCLARLGADERPPKLPEELASKDFFGCFRLWTGFFLGAGFLALGFFDGLTTPLRSRVLPRRFLLLFTRFAFLGFLFFTILFVFYKGGAMVFLPVGFPTVFLEGVSRVPARIYSKIFSLLYMGRGGAEAFASFLALMASSSKCCSFKFFFFGCFLIGLVLGYLGSSFTRRAEVVPAFEWIPPCLFWVSRFLIYECSLDTVFGGEWSLCSSKV